MKCVLLFIAFVVLPVSASDSLHYSGRLVNTVSSGVPIQGPVDLRVKIYQEGTEICMVDYLGHPSSLSNVALVNGLFNIDLDFTTGFGGSSLNKHFQESSDDLFEIEITDVTHSKVYGRQKIGSFPLALYAYDAKASSTDGLKFIDRDGMNHYIELKAPISLNSNYSYTLPPIDGSDGQVLKTDGAGNLSWGNSSVSGSSAISSIITSNSSGLSGGGDAGDLSLSVNIDASTFDITGNQIGLKNSGILAGKINYHPWHFSDSLGQFELLLDSGIQSSMLGISVKVDQSTIVTNASGAIEVGSIPASKVTGLVIPDTTDNLGDHTATKDLDLAGFNVIHLGYPLLDTDATSKGYVDTSIANSITSSLSDSLFKSDIPSCTDSAKHLTWDGVNWLCQNFQDNNSGGDFMADGSVPLTSNLSFKNSGSQQVDLSIPASIDANYALTLPPNNGNAGQFLTTDGTGILSWSAPAAPSQASSSTDGLLSATDWSLFNQKQSALPTGLSSDYLGGDHLLHSLPEAIRATSLTGFSVGSNSAIGATDTIIQSFEKGQGQIDALKATDTIHASSIAEKLSVASIPNCQGNLERLTWSSVTSTWSCSELHDNLGDHLATENLKMNGRWISSDGDDEGILISDTGVVQVSHQLNSDRICSAGGANCQQLEWKVVSTNYTAIAGDKLLVDTSVGPVLITLPAGSSQGDSIQFIDRMGTFDVNKLTVIGNGQDIMGVNEAMDVDLKNISFSLVLGGGSAGWRIQ